MDFWSSDGAYAQESEIGDINLKKGKHIRASVLVYVILAMHDRNIPKEGKCKSTINDSFIHSFSKSNTHLWGT